VLYQKNDGSVRIILDLSSPCDFPVNDSIPFEFFSVNYSSLIQRFSFYCTCFLARHH